MNDTISLWELCIHGQAYMHRTAGVDCPGGKEITLRKFSIVPGLYMVEVE